MSTSEQALVVGVGGGIGAALAQRWAASGRFERIWAVSRQPAGADQHPLVYRQTDHSEASINALVDEFAASPAPLTRIVIAIGTLHGDGYAPEKSLGALAPEPMQTLYHANCVLPLLWVAALAKTLRRSTDSRVAVLSARVGSIGDNQLGGWYSYRCAKAALNMGLRCASIELARRAPGVSLIAYHPGTVDTALSRPFQRSVPEGKLFTPAYAAQCLDTVLESAEADGELAYLDWAGKTIPW